MEYFLFLLISWLVFSALVAMLAGSQQRSFAEWFVISLLVSPILAFLGLLVLPNPKKEKAVLADRLARISCPFCSEQILRTAKICPHCRSDLVGTPKLPAPVKPMSEPDQARPAPPSKPATGSSPFSRPPVR